MKRTRAGRVLYRELVREFMTMGLVVPWANCSGTNAGLSFNLPLLTSLVPTSSAGSSTPTFTRATTKTVVDWEGVLRTALSGEACFTGARRVRNLVAGSSENFANGSWIPSTGGVGSAAVVTNETAALPSGATGTVSRVQLALNGGSSASDLSVLGQSAGGVSLNIVTSCWLRTRDGTTKIVWLRGASGTNGTLVTVTGSWQRFSGIQAASVLLTQILLRGGTGTSDSADLQAWGFQAEDVTGQSNQNPSEYVSVGVLSAPYQGAGIDGIQYFDYQNANTVASNVVTQAKGPAISSATLLGYDSWQAATNLCLQSADFTNASWVKTALTIGGSVVAPDGTTTALCKLQEDNTTAQHVAVQSFTKAASALVYTTSIYFKQAERTWGFIQIDDATNGNALFFNLASGVVGSNVVVGTGFTSVSATITPAANGFFRCTVTATSTTATTLRVTHATSTGDTVRSYAGTTGSGIYAWGAQLEQNAFATPYIPTTSAAVTRNADALTYALTGNIDPTLGSAYAEWMAQGFFATSPSNPRAVGSSTVSSGAPLLIVATNGQPRIYDGSTFASSGLPGKSNGALVKQASRWGGAAMLVAADGTLGTGQAFDGSIDMGNLAIGVSLSPLDSMNGTIRNVKIWTVPLTDGQLQQLTT